MNIYIEYLIFDNFIISLIAILVTKNISKTNVKSKNLIVAILLHILFAFLIPILYFNYQYIIILKTLILILTCAICVNREDFTKKFWLFFFIYFTVNLIIYAIITLFFNMFNIPSNLGVYYFDFPISLILLIVYVYFKILIKCFYGLKRKSEMSHLLYDVKLLFREKSVSFSAFLDSGNNLIDTKYNLPVAIISFKDASKLISESEMLSIYFKKQINSIPTLHYIKYSTASAKGGLMPVFKLDKMTILDAKGEREVDCALGLAFGNFTFDKNYNMLLSLKMFD